jgi:hypothetical protein
MPVVTQAVFQNVLVRPVERPGGADPALVRVGWEAPEQGERLVQVYVDGFLHDVTICPSQRALWLLLDRGRRHRVELLAVPTDQAWEAMPRALAGWSPKVRDWARVAVLRNEAFPVATRVRVSVDGATVDEGALWPADQPRAGFGAIFGEGGFGLDGATGFGLGEGALGLGPLGADGEPWRWQRADLGEGAREVRLEPIDASGRAVGMPLTREVEVARWPEAASEVGVDRSWTLWWR